jgi:Na+/H+ antiporter NhaD/arsenite permease-like protein
MLEFALPNSHALAVMVLIIVALILFTRENIPLQTTSLLVLVALTVGFTLFPFESGGEELKAHEFFLGFGHKALVAVCALMIVGQGLIRTGALEPVGRFLAKLWRKGPAISLLFTILITAVLSAFINNTPIVVLMLPILIGVAVRTGVSPSGTLIPMGFASILGGMSTTILQHVRFSRPGIHRRLFCGALPVADHPAHHPGPAAADERHGIEALHCADPAGHRQSGGR